MSKKRTASEAETFAKLLRADAILFEASKGIAQLGLDEIQMCLDRERRRIVQRLSGIQHKAYEQYASMIPPR